VKKRATKGAGLIPTTHPNYSGFLRSCEIRLAERLSSGERHAHEPGRPKKANAKVSVHLRLSPEVIAHFRARGPGWQTRIDEALRRAAKLARAK